MHRLNFVNVPCYLPARYLSTLLFAALLAVMSPVQAESRIFFEPIDLNLQDGLVNGQFEDQPLYKAIEAFKAPEGFKFVGKNALLHHPISGTFKDRPLDKVVKELMKPFNYTVIYSADGKHIQKLILNGLTAEAAAEAAAANPAGGPPVTPSVPGSDVNAGSPNGQPGQVPVHIQPTPATTGPGIGNETATALPTQPDYPGFIPAPADGRIPPELEEMFNPVQTPESRKHGPPMPEGFKVMEMPQGPLLINKTGPVGPDTGNGTLPPFEPITNTTGPQ